MINNRTIVANPSIKANKAAISRDPIFLANVKIIGLIVWKDSPPTISGADIAPSPDKHNKIESEKITGFNNLAQL